MCEEYRLLASNALIRMIDKIDVLKWLKSNIYG
jgi:hypothetical protein